MSDAKFIPLDRLEALERRAMREEQARQARADLLRSAYWVALQDREVCRRKMQVGEGVWYPEWAPLTPTERMALLGQLRHVFALPPDPRQRPAEGAPRRDEPDMREAH